MDILTYILAPLFQLLVVSAGTPASTPDCPAGQMAALKPASERRIVFVDNRWVLPADAYECVAVDAQGNVPGTGRP